MRKVIVFTRHDGGVSVTTPSDRCIRYMANGGRWDGIPRGFFQAQVERMVLDGINRDHASRFVNAMQFGGCTTAEALANIRDRDCARLGTMHELQDADSFPDKWFRNSWKRSPNGGPVVVDIDKARPLQLDHIKQAVKRSENFLTRVTLSGIRPRTRIDWSGLTNGIKHARDEEELYRVWPEGIPHPRRIAA